MYTTARARREAEEYSYRAYTTDALKAIAKAFGAEINKKWREVVRPENVEDVDADAVIEGIISGAELEVI
jgi:hypothetical protein